MQDRIMDDITVAKVWIDTEGIVHIGFPSNSTITLAVLQDIYKQHIMLTTEQRPVMVHAYTVTDYDKEAADFLWTEEVRALTCASALIAKSFFSKHLANLFLLYQSPPYPMRVFDNEISATGWLRKYL